MSVLESRQFESESTNQSPGQGLTEIDQEPRKGAWPPRGFCAHEHEHPPSRRLGRAGGKSALARWQPRARWFKVDS